MQITLKRPSLKSGLRATPRLVDSISNNTLANNPDKRWLEGSQARQDNFSRMQGKDVGLEWLAADDKAMSEPIIVEEPQGLGLEMPKGFTADDVVQHVGANHPVEVIGAPPFR